MQSIELDLNLPPRHHVQGYVSLESTSDLARTWGDSNEHNDHEFLWIWAREQTAGRGRRGREWVSRAGNLTTTVLMRPALSPAKASELSFVAALAIWDTIAAAIPNKTVELKWPNDVLVEGAKISGILLESSSASDAKLDWLSIGMGVNLKFHPEDVPYPATNLAREGATMDAISALETIIGHFDRWESQWQRKGFSPIRSAWLARAKGVGEEIVARLAENETRGTFEDLDEQGNLIIRLRSGDKRLISAGEVYFP